MRVPALLLLLVGAQISHALPSATLEQCAIWDGKIANYQKKLSSKDSREQKTHYRSKIEEYQKRLTAGRCQETRLAKVKS